MHRWTKETAAVAAASAAVIKIMRKRNNKATH
jgi:hypothetical protein